MAYIFARYQPPPPPEMVGMMDENAPKQIEAMDATGQIWALTDNSQVGDWLEFIAEGGTIEPAGTPMPEPPPVVNITPTLPPPIPPGEPVPEPEPTPKGRTKK